MEPIARDEMYLAAAAGEYSGELPEPKTRLEYYLKKIKEAVENGSSVAPEDIDAAIEAHLNSHDADIVTEQELSDALAGYYDKGDMDTALSGKAAASHAHDDRYYTETEIDNKLGEKSNMGHTHDDRYYTEDETDTLLSGKADSSDIPDVSAFITRLVNDLVNYYTKSETYTKAEIDSKVSAIPKFAIKPVNSLPSQDISETTVYLLTIQNGEQGNMYDEYIYVENAWEKLGTQTINLSGYYTAAEVDALLSGLSVSGHTHDDRYYTETEIDGKVQEINSAIAGKAASNHTHDDRYYTETEIDNKLSEKSNTGHSHVQSDITGLDSALAGKADANHNHSGVYAPASHTHTKSQITDLANAVASTNGSGGSAGLMSANDKEKLDKINIVVLTQAQYDAIASPDSGTLYLIPEEAEA